ITPPLACRLNLRLRARTPEPRPRRSRAAVRLGRLAPQLQRQLPRALESEQEALALEPARVAPQPSVLADHAVARDDDRERVATHRLADATGHPAAAQTGRQLAVRHGLAERNGPEQRPHPLVEGVAARRRPQLEARAIAREIVAELVRGLGEDRVGALLHLGA